MGVKDVSALENSAATRTCCCFVRAGFSSRCAWVRKSCFQGRSSWEKLLQAEQDKQREREKEAGIEAGLPPGGSRKDTELPELALRDSRRHFPEEAVQSLVTHRQAPKITRLSGGKGKFCFQMLYFKLCHPQGLNFLPLQSDFFVLRKYFRYEKRYFAQSEGTHGMQLTGQVCKVQCLRWNEREP